MLEKKEKHYSNFSISIFFLIIITIVGFIIRIYYMPENIPLTLDALRYFFYGMDVFLDGVGVIVLRGGRGIWRG